MSLNPDFRDLFAVFNAVQAKYLLVGGYALAFHGRPRFTKDLDVWVEASAENAMKVFTALESFGAPLQNLSIEDLSTPGLIFQIGVAPNRIDILTAIDGVDFEKAWPAREETRYGALSVQVLSRSDLLANKRSTGRPQDLLDAEELEKGG